VEETPKQESQKYVDEEYVEELFSSWKYGDLISYYEEIGDKNYSQEDKFILAQTYLNYWLSSSEEKNYSSKALSILNTIIPDDRINEFEISFYKWYANEIAWNIEEAKNLYKSALDLDLSIQEKTMLYNQIWYAYELEWDLFTAKEYYLEAENFWIDDEDLFVNIANYEIKQWNYEEAEKYLQKALLLTSDALLENKINILLNDIYLKRGTQ
jgi:tetratricopeptide (TPR) repeat protein